MPFFAFPFLGFVGWACLFFAMSAAMLGYSGPVVTRPMIVGVACLLLPRLLALIVWAIVMGSR
jgi:hypothetical protein